MKRARRCGPCRTRRDGAECTMRSLLAPKSFFDETIALINAGDLGAAETRCRSTLAAYPRDVNMLALLGALLVKLNRAAEAETVLAAGDRPGAHVREAARGSRPAPRSAESTARSAASPATRDASRPGHGERVVHARQGARRYWVADPRRTRRSRSCFALSPERRLMALAAEHQKEGRLDGGRASVSAAFCGTTRATSMR